MAETRAIRRAVRWSIPAVVVLALIVWFAVHAASASGAESDRYATATVTRGTVTETYTGSGTVDKVDQASTTFPVSAKVTSVHVAVGDKVKAGDPLATIDDSDLRVAVIEARQTSAEAEASLEQAQDAAAETVTSSAAPSATTAPSGATTPKAAATPKSAPSTPASRSSSSPSTGPSEPSGGGSHPAVDLEKLTQEVRTARGELATLQATATSALAAQQRTCAPVLGTTPTPSESATPGETPTPSQTATPSATGTPSASGTPSGTSTATSPTDGDAFALCIAAIQATGQGQQQVATQQTRVDQAVDALVRAATARTTNPGASPSAPTASAQPTRAGSNPTNSPTANARAAKTGGATTSGTENSAGQSTLTVGAAEAAVTKAKIALAAAEAKLGAATMTAPIGGTVAEVPFAAGETAGTDDAVVIVGGGDVQIQMAVTEAAFNTLKIGQRATITTPGGGRALGTVSARGLLPTESTSGSSSSTTFPVTVTASGRAAKSLPAGATGSVSVSLKSSPDAIVVPVSAVSRSGSVGVVQVLKDGTATRTTVKIGAVGGSTVEILEGLSPGDTLVLADNTTALPTNSSNRGLRAGGGGPPGGATQVGGGATGGR